MNEAERMMAEAERRMQETYGKSAPTPAPKPNQYGTNQGGTGIAGRDPWHELEKRQQEIEAETKRKQSQPVWSHKTLPSPTQVTKVSNYPPPPPPVHRPLVTYEEAGSFPHEEPNYKKYIEDLKPTYKPRRGRGISFTRSIIDWKQK